MGEIINGKCKDEFEKWFLEHYEWMSLEDKYETSFYDLEFEMQYGVYVNFFDEQGISIHIRPIVRKIYNVNIHHWGIEHDYSIGGKLKNRTEARKAAILKLNEILNNRLYK